MYVPDYGYGLVVRPGETKLTPLKATGEYTLKMETIVDLGKVGDTVKLEVKTELIGGAADEARQTSSVISQKEREKNCLRFYRSFFEKVELAGNLEIEFRDTLGQNVATVTERYAIADYWKPDDAENPEVWTADLIPFELVGYLHLKSVSGRKLPYALTCPLKVKQSIEVRSDPFVSFGDTRKYIKGPGFNSIFSSSVRFGRSFLSYEYTQTEPFIDAESVPAFFARQEELSENMNYFIQLGDEGKLSAAGTNWSWFKYLLTALTFAGMGLAFWKWGYRYDPPSKVPWSYQRSIGGWIILPIIGLCFSVLITSIQLFGKASLFSETVLRMLFDTEFAFHDPVYGIYCVFESIVTIGIFVLMVGNLILIFQRRTSVPRIMTLMYITRFGFLVITALAITYFNSQGYSISYAANVGWAGAGMGLFIWVPLLLTSQRSKDTFSVTLKPEPAGPTPPPVPTQIVPGTPPPPVPTQTVPRTPPPPTPFEATTSPDTGEEE